MPTVIFFAKYQHKLQSFVGHSEEKITDLRFYHLYFEIVLNKK